MNKTKSEIKYFAQQALKSEYGFAPALKDITLLESSRDGTYALFKVNGKTYRFESCIMTYGNLHSVWVGDGTIEKLS